MRTPRIFSLPFRCINCDDYFVVYNADFESIPDNPPCPFCGGDRTRLADTDDIIL